MKPGSLLLVALLATVTAVAQSNRPAAPASRAGGPGKTAATSGPDPDLFDGTKFDKEVRPDNGMLGEFEMPGSNDPQDKSKVGGNPGQAGGQQNQPPKESSGGGGAAAATPSAAGGAGGAESAANQSGGSSGGGASAENSGAAGSAGAAGGAQAQGKPPGSAGKSGGGGPAGKAEGMAADQLQGGANSAAQSAAQGKGSSGKIGSAELRIEPLPDADKDIIGREAAPGGTQGSNRAMPSGGATGSTNQNKGVEKGKVIPKGL